MEKNTQKIKFQVDDKPKMKHKIKILIQLHYKIKLCNLTVQE